MKILIDFENGMQLALKPENLQLIDNGGTAALVTRTENAVLPILFFKSPLATPEELKAREEKAAAAAKAAAEPPAPPTANAVPAPTPEPAAEPIDSATALQ
ncbi:MAG: hypothetical protein ACHQU0_03545 [Candidatus Paceibacteria bacterium]